MKFDYYPMTEAKKQFKNIAIKNIRRLLPEYKFYEVEDLLDQKGLDFESLRTEYFARMV